MLNSQHDTSRSTCLYRMKSQLKNGIQLKGDCTTGSLLLSLTDDQRRLHLWAIRVLLTTMVTTRMPLMWIQTNQVPGVSFFPEISRESNGC